jgi:hypothetical protein
VTQLANVPKGQMIQFKEEMDLSSLGAVFAKSGYFKDVNDASRAMVKILAGRELGIPPVQAMLGMHIIEGKPVISAGLQAACVKRSGKYDYRVVEHSDRKCRLEVIQGGKVIGTSEFTVEEATRAGLAGKSNWKNYPKDMLFSRAIGRAARHHCADVFGGPVYNTDEMIDAGKRPEGLTPEPEPTPTKPSAVDSLNAKIVADVPVEPPTDEPADEFADSVAFYVAVDKIAKEKKWTPEETDAVLGAWLKKIGVANVADSTTADRRACYTKINSGQLDKWVNDRRK